MTDAQFSAKCLVEIGLSHIRALMGRIMRRRGARKGLTLYLLTWRIWWAPNNASRWQMGFNSAFKWLNETCNITKRKNEGNVKRLVVKCLRFTLSIVYFVSVSCITLVRVHAVCSELFKKLHCFYATAITKYVTTYIFLFYSFSTFYALTMPVLDHLLIAFLKNLVKSIKEEDWLLYHLPIHRSLF
jgi:hypothetical protein